MSEEHRATESSTGWDVIVAGLGATGSAALHQLAARGYRVLGLDRYAPPHPHGSSHGRSRIIREAYFEDPRYVPLVQRAYVLWQALEASAGVHLLHPTGGLMLGHADGVLVPGARRSAETHGLAHDVLEGASLAQRAPAFRLPPDVIGLFEPRAGVLDPERAVDTMLSEARRHGAEVRTHEPLLAWRATEQGVVVDTSRGICTARQLVLALGAWSGTPLGDPALPLTVQRNVTYWFTPARDAEAFRPESFPVFLFEHAPGRMWYGFPDLGDGVKIALHGIGDIVAPDDPARPVSPEEIGHVRELLARYLPAADGTLRAAVTCLYTNTPDGHFVIDHHPAHRNVIVASPCSGHGFKFAPAVGELIADLVAEPPGRFDHTLFSARRFGTASEAGA